MTSSEFYTCWNKLNCYNLKFNWKILIEKLNFIQRSTAHNYVLYSNFIIKKTSECSSPPSTWNSLIFLKNLQQFLYLWGGIPTISKREPLACLQSNRNNYIILRMRRRTIPLVSLDYWNTSLHLIWWKPQFPHLFPEQYPLYSLHVCMIFTLLWDLSYSCFK